MSKNNYDEDLQYIANTQTLIGQKHRTLVDTETGEHIDVVQITKRSYGRDRFWKLYLYNFMNILSDFEIKKIDVLIYICEHTNPSTNLYIGSIRKTARKTGISVPTVQRTFRILSENNLLKQLQVGLYMVNPEIMLQGNDRKKEILLSLYREDDEEIKTQAPQQETTEETEEEQDQQEEEVL